MDTDNYTLLLNKKVIRIRNWTLEFKNRKTKVLSEEYSPKEAIRELEKLNLKLADLKEIFTINTYREKYNWELNWRSFLIDYDKHKYWKRYEIEVKADLEKEWKLFIDKIINHLWLDAVESKSWETKWMLYIKNEIPEMFEKILNNRL
jgi:uncharacterized protein YjbK